MRSGYLSCSQTCLSEWSKLRDTRRRRFVPGGFGQRRCAGRRCSTGAAAALAPSGNRDDRPTGWMPNATGRIELGRST